MNFGTDVVANLIPPMLLYFSPAKVYWGVLGAPGGRLGDVLGRLGAFPKRLDPFEQFWHRFVDDFNVFLGVI